MEIKVFIAVLIAALVHALWNGMVKHKNKYIAVSIVLGHVHMFNCSFNTLCFNGSVPI